DGTTALKAAQSFRPHVVFLDIGLPGMNGYEVCEAMRRDTGLNRTVIIAQTGWGQKEHLERSKKAGFDHHLIKPVDIKHLEKLLLSIRV
ncbi:MAG: response regulator, partial [Pseudomonadota bacterium]|nr:response regulator [Pseudomonadota bacterium]